MLKLTAASEFQTGSFAFALPYVTEVPTSFEVEFDAFIGGGTSPLDDPHRLDMAERDYEPIGGNGLALVYGILTSQPYDRGLNYRDLHRPHVVRTTASGGPTTVMADGTIILPLVGTFPIAGLTTAATQRKLNARLNGAYSNPNLQVSLVNQRFPFVSVIGEVRNPGRYPMEHDESIIAAIAVAGGLTEFADVKSVYLVRKYPQRVRVRFNYYDLAGGVACPSELDLRDGDVIVVE